MKEEEPVDLIAILSTPPPTKYDIAKDKGWLQPRKRRKKRKPKRPGCL